VDVENRFKYITTKAQMMANQANALMSYQLLDMDGNNVMDARVGRLGKVVTGFIPEMDRSISEHLGINMKDKKAVMQAKMDLADLWKVMDALDRESIEQRDAKRQLSSGEITEKQYADKMQEIAEGGRFYGRNKQTFGSDVSVMDNMQALNVLRQKSGLLKDDDGNPVTDNYGTRSKLDLVLDDLLYWQDAFARNWLVDSGLVSQSLYAQWQKDYPHHSYMERVKAQGKSGGGSGKTGRLSFFQKAATGSDLDTVNPLQSMGNYVTKMVSAVANEVVKQTMDDLYTQIPVARDVLDQFIVPEKLTGRKVSSDEQIKTTLLDMMSGGVLKRDSKGNLIKNNVGEEVEEHDPRTAMNLIDDKTRRELEQKPLFDVVRYATAHGINDAMDYYMDSLMAARGRQVMVKNNEIEVKRRGGGYAYYQVKHPDEIQGEAFMQMFQDSTPQDIRGLLAVLGAGKTIMTMLTTGSNPLFAPFNFVRDSMNLYVMGGMNPLTATKYMAKGFKDVIVGGKQYRNALAKGELPMTESAIRRGKMLALGIGDESRVGFDMQNSKWRKERMERKLYGRSGVGEYQTARQKASDFAAKVFGGMTAAFNAWNSIIEAAPRQAAFDYQWETINKEGRGGRPSLAEKMTGHKLNEMQKALVSLYDYEDSTTNFGNSGKTTVAKIYNRVVPFGNATLQGIDKFVREFFTRQKGWGHLAGNWARAVAYTTVLDFISKSLVKSAADSGDDKLTKTLLDFFTHIPREMKQFVSNNPSGGDIQDYTNDMYYLFPIPELGKDTYIRIPKVQEIGFFFDVLPTRLRGMYEADYGSGPEGKAKEGEQWSELKSEAMNNIIMPYQAWWQPIVDVMNNKTWYGGAQFSSYQADQTYQMAKVDPTQYIKLGEPSDNGITTAIAKGMNKQFSKNPIGRGVLAAIGPMGTPTGLNYVFNQLGGVIADFLTPLTSANSNNLKDSAVNVLKNRFIVNTVTNPKSMSMFYDTDTVLGEDANSKNPWKKQAQKTFDKLAGSNGITENGQTLVPGVNAFSKAIKAVQQSSEFTDEQKEKKCAQLYTDRDMLCRIALFTINGGKPVHQEGLPKRYQAWADTIYTEIAVKTPDGVASPSNVPATNVNYVPQAFIDASTKAKDKNGHVLNTTTIENRQQARAYERYETFRSVRSDSSPTSGLPSLKNMQEQYAKTPTKKLKQDIQYVNNALALGMTGKQMKIGNKEQLGWAKAIYENMNEKLPQTEAVLSQLPASSPNYKSKAEFKGKDSATAFNKIYGEGGTSPVTAKDKKGAVHYVMQTRMNRLTGDGLAANGYVGMAKNNSLKTELQEAYKGKKITKSQYKTGITKLNSRNAVLGKTITAIYEASKDGKWDADTIKKIEKRLKNELHTSSELSYANAALKEFAADVSL
jgi:hypothetical protein